ncbi:hypothetical protein X797_007012 [Metarhizium robertsii]|uniref:Myb-like DNA-binding domain-containing protein n=1 Tax=Metarhizium robertsii TaxID=568076 RepID=A0A014NDH3_9HYPO|nr:hypothetical protein X797_007012 [Metarhizium robertsii]
MPGTQDPSEQVKFLVSCIGHTNNGRPDFAAVAEELGIVTKAAAYVLLQKHPLFPLSRLTIPADHANRQKRYERMLKANGVSGTKSPTKTADDGAIPTPQTTPVKRKAAAARTPGSAKKTRGKAGKDVKKEESDGEKTKKGVKKEEDSESDLSGW